MTSYHRIGFIGAGAMSQSILSGIIRSGGFPPDAIGVVGKSTERAAQTCNRFGTEHFSNIEQLASSCDVIVLCIKPCDLNVVAKELKGSDLSGKLFISTLAGVSIKTLKGHFPTTHLVRSIPNVASAVGEGVTMWTSESEIPERLHEIASSFWASVGTSIEVSSEEQIDIGSPISGAAPAFMGIYIEAMVDAAVYLGLPRDTAVQLILQSAKGSCELISQVNSDAYQVRRNVTSPGGLTAVCIATLEARGFRTAILDAVTAGYFKTIELGK